MPAADDDLRRALRVRQDFGLDASLARVAKLRMSDPDMSDSFGVPMDPAEAGEIAERQRVLREDREPVEQVADEEVGVFGGSFMDNQTGKFTIAVTKDDERIEKKLKERVKNKDRIKVIRVEKTLRALQDVKADVLARRDEYKSQGIVISGVGPRESLNKVEVQVREDAPRAQQEFDRRYGKKVVVAEESYAEFSGGATNVQDSAPFRGGQHIRDVDASNYGCTSGFIGYRNTVPTTYFVITAGHCGAQNHLIYQVGRALGRVNARAAGENSIADGARLLFTPIVGGVDQRSSQSQIRE